MVVTEAALDNCCIANNVLASDQSGSTAVVLSSNNTNYYFMSNGSDCQAGMRFRLTVGNPGCHNQSSTSLQVRFIPTDYLVYTVPWSPQTNPDWSLSYYLTISADSEKAASSPVTTSLARSLDVPIRPTIIGTVHFSIRLNGPCSNKVCSPSQYVEPHPKSSELGMNLQVSRIVSIFHTHPTLSKCMNRGPSVRKVERLNAST